MKLFPLDFRLNTTTAFQLFHIIRQLSIIGISILLAKSSVTQSEIGNYEILTFILYAFSFFWVTGTIQGLLTYYPQLNTSEQKRLLFELSLYFIGVSGMLLSVLLWQSSFFIQLFSKQESLDYFHVFALYMLFNIPSYLIENIYLLKENVRGIVVFAIYTFGLGLLAVVLPIYLGFGFQGSYWALVGLAITKFIWLLLLLARNSKVSFQFKHLRQVVSLSFPLVLYALIGGFAQIFDGFLVNWHYDGDETKFAIFRYGAKELPFALAVAAAFSSSMLPKVATNLQASLQRIRSESTVLLHILFPIAILLAFFSQYFYPIVFNADFQESYVVFNAYLLILISRLIFPHTLLMGMKENRFILIVSIFELILNIGTSVILVQYYGLMGIALGTVIAYSFEKLAYVVYLQRRFQIRFEQYVHWKWFSFYSILLLFVFILVEWL